MYLRRHGAAVCQLEIRVLQCQISLCQTTSLQLQAHHHWALYRMQWVKVCSCWWHRGDSFPDSPGTVSACAGLSLSTGMPPILDDEFEMETDASGESNSKAQLLPVRRGCRMLCQCAQWQVKAALAVLLQTRLHSTATPPLAGLYMWGRGRPAHPRTGHLLVLLLRLEKWIRSLS